MEVLGRTVLGGGSSKVAGTPMGSRIGELAAEVRALGGPTAVGARHGGWTALATQFDIGATAAPSALRNRGRTLKRWVLFHLAVRALCEPDVAATAPAVRARVAQLPLGSTCATTTAWRATARSLPGARHLPGSAAGTARWPTSP
jgi:hypothetical protein